MLKKHSKQSSRNSFNGSSNSSNHFPTQNTFHSLKTNQKRSQYNQRRDNFITFAKFGDREISQVILLIYFLYFLFFIDNMKSKRTVKLPDCWDKDVKKKHGNVFRCQVKFLWIHWWPTLEICTLRLSILKCNLHDKVKLAVQIKCVMCLLLR